MSKAGISMDGLRYALSQAYEKMAKTDLDDEQIEPMQDLRQEISIFNCCFDDNDEHFNMLADKIKLTEIEE